MLYSFVSISFLHALELGIVSISFSFFFSFFFSVLFLSYQDSADMLEYLAAKVIPHTLCLWLNFIFSLYLL
jgi:hypothetical protein